MPRRPRPTSRRPPPTSAVVPRHNVPENRNAQVKPTQAAARQRAPLAKPETESDEEDEDEDESGSELADGDEEGEEPDFSDEEDVDVDAPRVAQYVDEEELDGEVDDSESSEDEEDLGVGSSNLKSLRNDLSSLPLGALRKAQQALSRAKVIGGSDDEADSDEEGSPDDSGSEPEEQTSQFDLKGKQKEPQVKEKKEIAKRKHKHAPMEMTSKRPVPRRKIEIEEKKPVPRDPRFLPVTGEFSADKFRSQYGFLSEMHEQEMKTLKDNLKRARKMLASSPRDLREEREQEVQRLERAVKRSESLVNRDRREKIEASALARARKEEKEKRMHGKGAWHMKNADKKELLVRAKFEALAESGGRGAVRKAIEKKQKKVNQKEKKRRPFVPGEKRPGGQSLEARPHKRRKF